MSKDTTNAEESDDSSEPELESATTTDEDGNGADPSALGVASNAEGADKREPASTDDTRKASKPFDLSEEIGSIIDEVEGQNAKDSDEKKPEATDEEKTSDDAADAKKETADEDDAKDGDKAEAKDEEKSDAEDKKPEADPDEPTEEALSKYPKDARKQIKRAWNKVRELSTPAKVGNSITNFARERNIEPHVLKDSLELIADVVNAKDPEEAFDRLADQAISLVENKNPDEMTPREKAVVLRRMADRLAPEEKPAAATKPAEEQIKLPEALQDLVDTGELTLKAAQAAHLAENPPKAKETPPPAPATAKAKPTNTNGAADIARSSQQAREARGKADVAKVETELATAHKETWAKIKPVLREAISKYKGAPPELWGQIVRDQGAIAAKRFEQPPKKVGRTLTPSRGRSTTDTRDDLDKILDEA